MERSIVCDEDVLMVMESAMRTAQRQVGNEAAFVWAKTLVKKSLDGLFGERNWGWVCELWNFIKEQGWWPDDKEVLLGAVVLSWPACLINAGCLDVTGLERLLFGFFRYSASVSNSGLGHYGFDKLLLETLDACVSGRPVISHEGVIARLDVDSVRRDGWRDYGLAERLCSVFAGWKIRLSVLPFDETPDPACSMKLVLWLKQKHLTLDTSHKTFLPHLKSLARHVESKTELAESWWRELVINYDHETMMNIVSMGYCVAAERAIEQMMACRAEDWGTFIRKSYISSSLWGCIIDGMMNALKRDGGNPDAYVRLLSPVIKKKEVLILVRHAVRERHVSRRVFEAPNMQWLACKLAEKPHTLVNHVEWLSWDERREFAQVVIRWYSDRYVMRRTLYQALGDVLSADVAQHIRSYVDGGKSAAVTFVNKFLTSTIRCNVALGVSLVGTLGLTTSRAPAFAHATETLLSLSGFVVDKQLLQGILTIKADSLTAADLRRLMSERAWTAKASDYFWDSVGLIPDCLTCLASQEVLVNRKLLVSLLKDRGYALPDLSNNNLTRLLHSVAKYPDLRGYMVGYAPRNWWQTVELKRWRRKLAVRNWSVTLYVLRFRTALLRQSRLFRVKRQKRV